MASEPDQVKALQQAIIDRAQQLAAEHIAQARLTRDKLIEDAREKIQLREKKELLLARLQADRLYQQRVQANELRIQAELDRNRWGLVESIMADVLSSLAELQKDRKTYALVFEALLKHAVSKIQQPQLIASINKDDLTHFKDNWSSMVASFGDNNVQITLSDQTVICSGGVTLISQQGDVRIDNTFEGIIARREEPLHQLIFEHLFASAAAIGAPFHG